MLLFPSLTCRLHSLIAVPVGLAVTRSTHISSVVPCKFQARNGRRPSLDCQLVSRPVGGVHGLTADVLIVTADSAQAASRQQAHICALQ